MDKLLLGIDIGSYESKGVITDRSGYVRAYASIPHMISFPQPGWAEQDADQIWWSDFCALSRKLLQQWGISPHQIASVGVSGMSQCAVPIDKLGNPLMPAILYGIDTRAYKEVEEINRIFGPEKIMEHCGHRIMAQDLGPRLLWIRNNKFDVYQQMAGILTTSSFLVYRLTGKQIIDIYSAINSAPMFDIYQHKYLPEMTGDLIEQNKLPEPVWSTQIVGYVTDQAALDTELAAGTPVIAGTADAAAEALSCGLSSVGDLMIMYGSSTFFILKTDHLVLKDMLWGNSFLEPNTFAVLAGMSVGGSLISWFRDQFGQQELEIEKTSGENAFSLLAQLSLKSKPGANGLIMLPYFSGERTPIYDPSARGVLLGLNLTHTRADVYQAVLESIGYGICHNVETLKGEDLKIKRILAVGGGIKNRIWLQIVSDILGQQQLVPIQQYGACYGDAFLAGIGIGEFSSPEILEWIRYSDPVLPNLKNTAVYDQFFQIYRKLYNQTSNLMHEIAKTQEDMITSL